MKQVKLSRGGDDQEGVEMLTLPELFLRSPQIFPGVLRFQGLR